AFSSRWVVTEHSSNMLSCAPADLYVPSTMSSPTTQVPSPKLVSGPDDAAGCSGCSAARSGWAGAAGAGVGALVGTDDQQVARMRVRTARSSRQVGRAARSFRATRVTPRSHSV